VLNNTNLMIIAEECHKNNDRSAYIYEKHTA